MWISDACFCNVLWLSVGKLLITSENLRYLPKNEASERRKASEMRRIPTGKASEVGVGKRGGSIEPPLFPTPTSDALPVGIRRISDAFRRSDASFLGRYLRFSEVINSLPTESHKTLQKQASDIHIPTLSDASDGLLINNSIPYISRVINRLKAIAPDNSRVGPWVIVYPDRSCLK